jgi:hypothetical protein
LRDPSHQPEYEKSKSFQFDGSLSSLVATDTYFLACVKLCSGGNAAAFSAQQSNQQLSGRHNILLLMHFDQFSAAYDKRDLKKGRGKKPFKEKLTSWG